jgi:acyl-CoA synthetase (NDP forming)
MREWRYSRKSSSGLFKREETMNDGRPKEPDSGLEALFNPRAIAILGASPDPNKFQGKILKYLLKHGYEGKIYPINPSYEEVFNLPCYPSLASLPGDFDLVVVIIRSDKVLAALQEAYALGCRASVVISSDFAESGEEGRKRQEEIEDFAKSSGMRVLGPNCLGYINVSQKIAASGCTSLEKDNLIGGGIGLITQSGALMGSIYGRAQDEGIGHNYVVSTGNEADVEAAEVMRYMLNDPGIGAVTGFIETFRDLDNFLAVSDLAAELKKPVVVLKVGQSEKGRQATSTHTGAMAGSNVIARAVFKKQGIVQVDTIDQLYRTTDLLLKVPPSQGDHVGIFTISGGACSWLADCCDKLGIPVPDLTPQTKERLSEIFQYGFPSNPLDVTGQAISNQAYFSQLLDIFMEDENLDIILIGMTAMPFPLRAAQDLARAAKTCSKPFIVFWTFDQVGEEAYASLRQANVPLFHSSNSCLKGIKHLIAYSQFQRERSLRSSQADFAEPVDRKRQADKFLSNKAGKLNEYDSKKLLNIYGIETPRELLSRNSDEALLAAHAIGYPIALKVLSPEIVHKTDLGVIRLNISRDEDLRKAYDESFMTALNSVDETKVDGVLVQEMIGGGMEVYVGLSVDEVFGPGVLFGLGGTLVELFRDKVVGIPPLTGGEAKKLIMDTPAGKILEGYRGGTKYDLDALTHLIVRMGELGLELRDQVIDIDLNPVIVSEEGRGIKVIDATVSLQEPTKPDKIKER